MNRNVLNKNLRLLVKNCGFIHSFLYVLVIINTSCFFDSHDAEKLEKEVYTDIFPELVEKTFTDFRKLSSPPPPPKNNSKEEIEKMRLAFEQSKKDQRKYLDTTAFTPLNIVISDSVIGYTRHELKALFKYSKFYDSLNPKKPFKLDLENINIGDKYILKHESDLELPLSELENRERLKYSTNKKHLWQYSGMLYLYRIYFNDAKDFGVLQVGYNCGKLCGCGYVVYVKKVNDNWVIDEIESTGCA